MPLSRSPNQRNFRCGQNGREAAMRALQEPRFPAQGRRVKSSILQRNTTAGRRACALSPNNHNRCCDQNGRVRNLVFLDLDQCLDGSRIVPLPATSSSFCRNRNLWSPAFVSAQFLSSGSKVFDALLRGKSAELAEAFIKTLNFLVLFDN